MVTEVVQKESGSTASSNVSLDLSVPEGSLISRSPLGGGGMQVSH